MKYLIYIVIGYLALDVACFMLWVLSGQLPTDNFFFGSITSFVLHSLFY